MPSRNASRPTSSIASNVTPSMPAAPPFASRHLVSLAQRLRLAHMDVQPPETPVLVSLRLEIYSPPQVLQTCGRLCHPVPAFLVVRETSIARAPLLRGHYPASALLHAHPPPSRLRPISRCCGYGPTLLRRFPAGTRRASPVARSVLVIVPPLSPRRSGPGRINQLSTAHAAFALRLWARPSEYTLEATCAFTCVAARRLAISPWETLSIGFRNSVSLLPAIQATGLLIITPAGLSPH